jgi:hypothetical protein
MMRDWRFLLKVRLGSLIHSQDAAGEFGNMHRMIPNKALNLTAQERCSGGHVLAARAGGR